MSSYINDLKHALNGGGVSIADVITADADGDIIDMQGVQQGQGVLLALGEPLNNADNVLSVKLQESSTPDFSADVSDIADVDEDFADADKGASRVVNFQRTKRYLRLSVYGVAGTGPSLPFFGIILGQKKYGDNW